jgi:hypothetical protein
VAYQKESSRKKEPEPAPPSNVCIACGVIWTRNEQRPFEWDSHATPRGLVDTCSKECRRQMGFAERKVVFPDPIKLVSEEW